MKSAVAASEIKQRIEPRLERGLLHFANQDEVIATFVDGVASAFEHRKRVHQDRYAMLSHTPWRATEPILDPRRKSDRSRLLLGLQNVDRKMLGLAQRHGACGGLRNTNQQ